MNALFAHRRNLKLTVLAAVLVLGTASAADIASSSLTSKVSGLISDSIQATLNLNAQQTLQLEKIRLQGIANLKFIQEQIAATRSLLEAELTQIEPDLRMVVTDARTRFDAAHTLVQANMDNRLALYEGMTTEQKQIVCAEIQKHLERIDLLQLLALQLLSHQSPISQPSELVGEPIQAALNLSDQQTSQLELIRQQGIENFKFIQAQTVAIQALLETELTQIEPDLRMVVTDARTRFDAVHTQIQVNMDSRLAFYEGMTTEQKQIVCAEIQKHLGRVDLLQQLVLQLLGNTT